MFVEQLTEKDIKVFFKKLGINVVNASLNLSNDGNNLWQVETDYPLCDKFFLTDFKISYRLDTNTNKKYSMNEKFINKQWKNFMDKLFPQQYIQQFQLLEIARDYYVNSQFAYGRR